MKKKKIVVVALAVCLIAILSLSSLAWFNDADSVTNDFLVGGDGTDADKIFSLDVYEQVDGDRDGTVDHTIGWDGDTSPDGLGVFAYENVVPGDLLLKRVYGHNKGLYDQWVRFKITFSNASAWKQLEAEYGIKLVDVLMESATTKLVDSTQWTFAANETVMDTAADTVTFVFYANEVLHADNGNVITLFDYVQVPWQFDQHDMAMFADGKFQLVAVGEAVQVENINATNAIDAFLIVSGAKPNT